MIIPDMTDQYYSYINETLLNIPQIRNLGEQERSSGTRSHKPVIKPSGKQTTDMSSEPNVAVQTPYCHKY